VLGVTPAAPPDQLLADPSEQKGFEDTSHLDLPAMMQMETAMGR
jgi:hypothetical protein